MSRAVGLLRALQRLPAASAGIEATSALRAKLSSCALTDVSKDLFGTQGFNRHGKFNTEFRSLPMSFSFASQMHTLTGRKEDEQQSVALSSAVQAPPPAGWTPPVPKALTALPPRPTTASGKAMAAAAKRGMASSADAGHLELNQAHPFHILPPSPWPFLSGYGLLLMLSGMAGWFHAMPHMGAIMFTGLGSLFLTATAWWRDCMIESDLGMHTGVQKQNLINGIWLFIGSEAALFFGLLWACVHLGMSPSVWVQMQWPPVGIEAIGWEGRALVMSAVLAASYYSANVAVVAKDPKVVIGALATTLGLGVLFLADQFLEYSTAPFTITDGPYGTTFFMTTGFHGFHVLVGSAWLAVALANYMKHHKQTLTLKGAVLYWHFVDIVWIAVYGIIYCAQL